MDSARGTRAGEGPAGLEPDAEPTLRQKARYAFDNTMARGTPALVGWLAAVALAMIVLFTIIVLISGLGPKRGTHSGVLGHLLDSLLHALDPGTIASDTGRWPFIVLMLAVTLGGLFIVSALIGIIATGLDSKIDELRKGRSVVLETDHTLILGWSDSIFTILSELEIANASEKGRSAVVLAEQDKVEMDDLIREKVRPKVTRVVTRSGSPIDLGHLALVRPEKARSIIVLAPEDDPEPDAQVIKTVLALTQGTAHRDRDYEIVAEIENPTNLRAAGLVGGEEAVLIDKRETVAKLVVHSARQSGASVAFTELLDFAGDEIYFRDDPSLVDRTFGELLLRWEECAPIGIIDDAGRVKLNPEHDRTLVEGDRVIAVAEDDAALAAASEVTAEPVTAAIAGRKTILPRPESVLLLGWNRGATSVITEFDAFLRPGSDLTVVAESEEAERTIERDCVDVGNVQLTFQSGSPTDREILEGLGIERFDHIVVLCCSDDLDAQRADARTLVTLLHLRDIGVRRDAKFSIVSEMLDDRNRELAEVTEVDDVIVSGKVISLMLAQISENRHLAKVFGEIFSADGSEIYLRPAGDYVSSGAEINFATVVEAARQRGECALGYRFGSKSKDPLAAYGVRVNVPKSEPITVAPEDRVIVLAED